MNIILLGPIGSGKGTQARLLVENFGLVHFESGQYLRKLAPTNPKIAETMKEGKLLDDETMLWVVKSFFKDHAIGKGVVFDGFPRKLPQFHLLEEMLTGMNQKVNLAIYLDLSKEEAVRRVSARRQDPKTGEIYNLITDLPPADVDINTLTIRSDDTPEAIEVRYNLHHETLAPLISELETRGLLYKIDASQSVEEIYSQISEIVNSKLS
jgi:adenylate kinase